MHQYNAAIKYATWWVHKTRAHNIPLSKTMHIWKKRVTTQMVMEDYFIPEHRTTQHIVLNREAV